MTDSNTFGTMKIMFELMRLIIAPGQVALFGDVFLLFFNMKVCCVFSLELPHPGDFNEYIQHTTISIIKKITLNYSKYNDVCCYGNFS